MEYLRASREVISAQIPVDYANPKTALVALALRERSCCSEVFRNSLFCSHVGRLGQALTMEFNMCAINVRLILRKTCFGTRKKGARTVWIILKS